MYREGSAMVKSYRYMLIRMFCLALTVETSYMQVELSTLWDENQERKSTSGEVGCMAYTRLSLALNLVRLDERGTWKRAILMNKIHGVHTARDCLYFLNTGINLWTERNPRKTLPLTCLFSFVFRLARLLEYYLSVVCGDEENALMFRLLTARNCSSDIHLLKRMQVGRQCQRALNKQSLTFAWEILWILHLWRPNYEFNYKNSFIYRSMRHYSLNILVTFKPNTNWRGVNSNAGWVVVLSITETVVL